MPAPDTAQPDPPDPPGPPDASDERMARRLRALLDASPNAILLVDRDGRIRFANEAVRETFGYRPESLAGHLVEVLVPDAVRGAHAAMRAGFAQGGHRRQLGLRTNIRGRRADGTTFPADVALGAAELDDGPGVVVNVIDVEARHRLEERLLQAQKMELMGRFAGMLAHDMRNYLSAIGGLADLAAASAGPAAGELALIREVVARAEAAMGNILGVGRPPGADAGPTDPGPFLEANRRVLEHLAGPRCTLRVEVADGLPPAAVEPGALAQVLMNLVTNARDAMPGGGEIVLAAAPGELRPPAADGEARPAVPAVTIAVRDHGVGMDEATRARIFEPFFSTKAPGSAGGSGSGLGLASVEMLVARAGGAIAVQSAPGAGACFEVVLPADTPRTGKGEVGGFPR